MSGPRTREGDGTAYFWFRRDLRLEDNTGLHAAISAGRPVQPLFIVDTNITDELLRDDPRFFFIYVRLEYLQRELRRRGSSLLVLQGTPGEVWKRLTENQHITAVYTNTDYEPYARQRDREISRMLEARKIPFHAYRDQVMYHENDILKPDGTPYSVYTPYSRRWKTLFEEEKETGPLPTPGKGFLKSDHPLPELPALGFRESQIRVPPIDLSVAGDYAENRDFPAREGTTGLSPHLRFGTVGFREVIRRVRTTSETLLGELIWREFFMQVLYHHPRVVDENFNRKYDGIRWRNSEAEFRAWCRGETGYPLVDAGMRELNQTGIMHNRVRMVCASFLCKHLLTDWRWGEAYFAEKLLDYELSSNNGNWQWAAGTGCDAAPYFRIFNPSAQLKRFDPELAYVRKWVPEYGSKDYPAPMVEHAMARERALKTYKAGIGQ